MNHELVMLQGALRMKKCAMELDKEAKRLALRSFKPSYKGGTLGQMQVVCQYVSRRDYYLAFYQKVVDALRLTPKRYRNLIIQVYLQCADKKGLCRRREVSLSTLYRTLAKARRCFREKLYCLGCDENWLVDNYGGIFWVRQKLCQTKGRYPL